MAAPIIAVASSAEVIGNDEDQPVLEEALRAVGCDVRLWAWDDPGAAWADADLVVIRSTWDYVPRHEAFCAWADRIANVTALHNPPEIVRWNSDKHYLAELEAAGVAITPTTWLEPGEAIRLPEVHEVVVKPTVSAGSQDTTRHDLRGGDETAHDAAAALLAAGRSVMVQPYLEGLDERGETGLVYVDGAFHHAFRKAPILVQGRSATERLYAPEQITATAATPAELALAEQTLAQVAGTPLLYARVDVAPSTDGRPVLMELELVEPSLFFAACDQPADTLAGAVRRRVADPTSS